MNVLEANELFQKRISSNSSDNDGLDPYPIRFLKLALDLCVQASDMEIGSFEAPSEGIAYNGYCIDEDQKEFHIVTLAFFDDPSVTPDVVVERIDSAKIGVFSFIKEALLPESRRSVSPVSEISEHMSELKEAIDNKYELFIDCFLNAELPQEPPRFSYSYNGHAFSGFCYGANDVAEAIDAEDEKSLLIDFKNSYQKPLKVVKIASTNDFDVYEGGIEGSLLAKVYRDHKTGIMDGNVRAYLKRTQKVNKGISETLRYDPENFVAFNNGLSTIADGEKSTVVPLGIEGFYQIEALNRFQIVNGGQTTVTIYLSFYSGSRCDESLDNVIVPIKITVLKRTNNEANLISSIAEFANTQTAIKRSDLASNSPFYKTLEALSQCVFVPSKDGLGNDTADSYGWFFERTAGLYATKKRLIYGSSKTFDKRYPEKKKFSKSLLAKAINACSVEPMTVCLGNEKSFESFNRKILLKESRPDELYFKRAVAAIILWKEVDKIVKKEGLPIKAAVSPYVIACLAYYTEQRLDLDSIWASQGVSSNVKEIIRQLAICISGYFVSVQGKYPNTAMYARKGECWEAVKRQVQSNPIRNYIYALRVLDKPYNFFPESPAASFIDLDCNFYNTHLWHRLEAWNDKAKVLSPYEQNKCHDFLMRIGISGRSSIDQMTKKKCRDIFLKAVRNGFPYNK